MNKSFCIAAGLCVLMLSGCASNRALVQPIMHSKQTPVLSSGYVAGMFTRKADSRKSGIGLGIVNTATAEEYVMPIGVERPLPTDVTDEFEMIQLPPGEYKVANWLNYSTKDGELISKTSILSNSMSDLSFTLAPGEVVFIGSYVARMDGNNPDGNKTMTVIHQRLTLRSAQKALTSGYPGFTTVPLSCKSCLE